MRSWPQKTWVGTGAGPIVQAYILVVNVLAASVARTQNSWLPEARSV